MPDLLPKIISHELFKALQSLRSNTTSNYTTRHSTVTPLNSDATTTQHRRKREGPQRKESSCTTSTHEGNIQRIMQESSSNNLGTAQTLTHEVPTPSLQLMNKNLNAGNSSSPAIAPTPSNAVPLISPNPPQSNYNYEHRGQHSQQWHQSCLASRS